MRANDGGRSGWTRTPRGRRPPSGAEAALLDVSPQVRTFLKLAAAVALAVVAVAFVSKRVGGFRKTGEQGATAWFYDQSEKRLYEVPRDTIPPHKGIGGPSGDGVRAVVVVFRAEQSDARKRRIAYLETYTPELKGLLEKVQAARAAGQAFKAHLPPRDSAYFQTNSLVKGPEESEWHASSSPEGRRAMTKWRSWRGPDGQPPVVCLP